MGKRKRGKSAKNARKGLGSGEPEELVKAPHSFVINRGRLGKNANELLLNFRKVMEPFTASQLKVQKQNVLKDFVHMAGPLNVSHLVVFTKSQTNMYLKIMKLPRGPTLTFEIKDYCLIRDIINSQKKPLMYEKLFTHHPMLVMNNFSGEGMHFKLMTTMFQNMFPSINPNKVNLNTIRRCLVLNYNADKTIDFRQYATKMVPTGVSKAVKKLIQSKVPNLGQFQEVYEFMQCAGNLSESEVEVESAANTVVLPQPISSRGNITSEESSIKFFEMGPSLKLQLIKIEEGLMDGEVIFHEYFKRTPEEIDALKKKIKAQKLLKEKRKAEQQKNVERKKQLAEKKDEVAADEADVDESEDDRQWYRREVGEEPDDNILPSLKKKKHAAEKQQPSKKKKVADGALEKVKSQEDNVKAVQEFLKKRKKRKEAKVAKKNAKKISQKVMSIKAKNRENIGKKSKKKV